MSMAQWQRIPGVFSCMLSRIYGNQTETVRAGICRCSRSGSLVVFVPLDPPCFLDCKFDSSNLPLVAVILLPSSWTVPCHGRGTDEHIGTLTPFFNYWRENRWLDICRYREQSTVHLLQRYQLRHQLHDVCDTSILHHYFIS
jgi:hypothetical protein